MGQSAAPHRQPKPVLTISQILTANAAQRQGAQTTEAAGEQPAPLRLEAAERLWCKNWDTTRKRRHRIDNPPDPDTTATTPDPAPQATPGDAPPDTLTSSTPVSVRDRPLEPLQRPLTYQVFFVLHFFSGQRRECDLQWHLEDLNQGALLPVVVLSLDVANDAVLGDLTNSRTVAVWLDLLLQGKVVGILAAPPCET